MSKFFRWFCLLALISTLTGCFYWIRAYQTYVQMEDFDQHFAISATDKFSLSFKDPILYSDDLISLAKLQPSVTSLFGMGEKWRYWFRKVDNLGVIIKPEVKFYFDLSFNEEQHLTRLSFSPLFLQIAPAEFLEISLRSLGSAEINTETRQLKANTDLIEKIGINLPQKKQILEQIGPPLEIKHEDHQDVYYYHFKLETHDIEPGYEDRSLSIIKLTFDKETDELIRMAGRFAGLKVSINYRKYIANTSEQLT